MGTFIKYELGKINNKDVIFIRFAYDAELVARVKKLVGVQWSQTQHAWYVPANTAYLKKFKIAAAPVTAPFFQILRKLFDVVMFGNSVLKYTGA